MPHINLWEPCCFAKFPDGPPDFLMSSCFRKKEPRYACLSEAKASHSQTMWAEVSSFAPHLLHSGLSSSSSRWRSLLSVLCPVRRPVTAPDWVLLTLTLLTWRIRWAPNNASRWQMGFNSVFKGLNYKYFPFDWESCPCNYSVHQRFTTQGESQAILTPSSKVKS